MKALQKGASLLELMLVVAVAGLFIILSFRYYEHYKKIKEIAFFQTTISELMNALNSYYYANCAQKNVDLTAIDLPKLQAWQYEKKLRLIGDMNTALADFSVGIIDINKDQSFYMLQVKATLKDNNIKLADYIRGSISGDPQGIGTNMVTWTRLPLFGLDELSSRQWIMDQGTGQDFMPGRFTTAVNTGFTSKFWVLNSNLQSYAQLNIDEKMFPANRICPN